MPVKLYDIREEQFAQAIVSGLSLTEAGAKIGISLPTASNLLRKKDVNRRINELLKRTAKRAELQRTAILDRMLEDWDQARRQSQMTAAITAGKLLGQELHGMFVDRKEIGRPGDFDNKTEAELREYIASKLAEMGMSVEDVTAHLQNPQNLPAIIDAVATPVEATPVAPSSGSPEETVPQSEGPDSNPLVAP